MTDFNALVEAEVERCARQWERTEERLHEEIGKLQGRLLAQREEGQRLKATFKAIEAVLDDFYGSPEPRHIQHALDAVRRIMDGRTAT